MKNTASWPLQAPARKPRRTRRLRKKLRVGEFREMGFEVSFDLREGLDQREQGQVWDAFILEAIEAEGLEFGGGSTGFICAQGRGSLAEPHREQLAEWFAARPEVASAQVGPLVDAWYGPWDQLGDRPANYDDLIIVLNGLCLWGDRNSDTIIAQLLS